MISLANNGQLTLWNNAARRLFGAVDLAQASHLQQFGEAFYRAITDIRVGERRLVKLLSDDQELTLAVVASEMTSAGHSEKILSLQNIQQELDDTQLDAWQELVRVLTHEILNSITPVASLSKTSVQLLEDLTDRLSAELELSDELGDELADIKEAVETVARRSDGLMNFVASYRKLTRLPSPQRESFSIRDLFDGLMRIMAARDDASNIAVTTRIMPESLMLQADRAMIEQILINLLQNASQANTSKATVEVSLGARLNRRGQIAIEVADNGPGIPAALVKRVFVPFFTTRRDGSGVGLALSRQIMIAHGGNISAGRAPAGGALITLNF